MKANFSTVVNKKHALLLLLQVNWLDMGNTYETCSHKMRDKSQNFISKV